MITKNQKQRLRGLGFKIVNIDEEQQQITTKFEGTKKQLYQSVPDEWNIESKRFMSDSPALVRLSRSFDYSD